jgi:hypothetical protein
VSDVLIKKLEMLVKYEGSDKWLIKEAIDELKRLRVDNLRMIASVENMRELRAVDQREINRLKISLGMRSL